MVLARFNWKRWVKGAKEGGDDSGGDFAARAFDDNFVEFATSRPVESRVEKRPDFP